MDVSEEQRVHILLQLEPSQRSLSALCGSLLIRSAACNSAEAFVARGWL